MHYSSTYAQSGYPGWGLSTPQAQRQSEMCLSLLADGPPALPPERARVCKAQGRFGVARSPCRGPVGPLCLHIELSQHDCCRALAPDVQRLKSPGSAAFDPVTELVWIQLGVSPFWAELQQTLHECPVSWGPGRCLSWVQLDPSALQLVPPSCCRTAHGAGTKVSLQQLPGPTRLAQNHS